MEPPSSTSDSWEIYQQEFEKWLDEEIKILEQRLKDLKRIKENLDHDD